MRGGYVLPGLSLGSGYGLGFVFLGRGHPLEIRSVRYGPGALGAGLCILKAGPRRKLASKEKEKDEKERDILYRSRDSFRRLVPTASKLL